MARLLPVSSAGGATRLGLRLGLGLALSLGLAACHAPAPKLPDQPTDLPAEYGSIGRIPPAAAQNLRMLDAQALAEKLGTWWQLFNDPVLNNLVDLTITNNWDLQIATQRIEAAIAEVSKIDATALPMVYGQADASRQQSGTTNVLGMGLYDTFGFQAAVSWEPDVFGRVAAQSRAAQAEQAALEADRRAMMVSMTAEVVLVYAQLRAMQQKLILTEKYVALMGAQVALTKDLLRSGLAATQALAAMQRQFLEAKSAIPALKARIDILITTCAILTGGYPNSLSTLLNQPGPMLEAKQPLPDTLPSQLLRQRPDITAQEQRMLASLSEVQAAEAQFLPVFAIPLNVGYNTGPFNLLLNPASFIWNLAASAFAPIYTSGFLESNLKIAESVSQENRLEYEQLVRRALQEVENAVVGYQGASQTLDVLEAVNQEQRVVVSKEKTLFATGLQSLFQVNSAELLLTEINQNIVDTEYEQALELVSLYRALGGGWRENSLAATPTASTPATEPSAATVQTAAGSVNAAPKE
jgi:NodT family efflux transporter outer membrane factor (OMF) lipoprotein